MDRQVSVALLYPGGTPSRRPTRCLGLVFSFREQNRILAFRGGIYAVGWYRWNSISRASGVSKGMQGMPDPSNGHIYHNHHRYWWKVLFQDGINHLEKHREKEVRLKLRSRTSRLGMSPDNCTMHFTSFPFPFPVILTHFTIIIIIIEHKHTPEYCIDFSPFE